jgi:hypothetical protein
MDIFKKKPKQPQPVSNRRDGGFYKQQVLRDVKANSIPTIVSLDTYIVMKPTLRLRYIDSTTKQAGVSVFVRILHPNFF